MGHHVARPKPPPVLRQIYGATLALPGLQFFNGEAQLVYRMSSLYRLRWSPRARWIDGDGGHYELDTEHLIDVAISQTGIDLRAYLSDAERRWSALGLLLDTTGWSR